MTSCNSSHSKGARTANLFAVTVGLYLIAWCRDASMLALMLQAGVTHGLAMFGAGVALEFKSNLLTGAVDRFPSRGRRSSNVTAPAQRFPALELHLDTVAIEPVSWQVIFPSIFLQTCCPGRRLHLWLASRLGAAIGD